MPANAPVAVDRTGEEAAALPAIGANAFELEAVTREAEDDVDEIGPNAPTPEPFTGTEAALAERKPANEPAPFARTGVFADPLEESGANELLEVAVTGCDPLAAASHSAKPSN